MTLQEYIVAVRDAANDQAWFDRESFDKVVGLVDSESTFDVATWPTPAHRPLLAVALVYQLAIRADDLVILKILSKPYKPVFIADILEWLRARSNYSSSDVYASCVADDAYFPALNSTLRNMLLADQLN